jgi:prophage tail gpP-like protein
LQFGSVETGQTFSAVFDDTMVYQIYRVLGDSPRSNTEPSFATAIDDNIPVPRRKTLTALNETKGGIQKTADWTKNKSLAESLGIPFPVTNWRTPAGDLWEPNQLVTVTSPTIFVPDGFDFLIRQVEFIDDEGGETAALDIVPPQLYTQENIPEPWA